MSRLITMVALRGGSSKNTSVFRRLAEELPALLRRQLRPKKTRRRQMQRRHKPKQVEQLITEYLAGDSMLKLARRWRLHQTTVAEHLHRAGIPVRRRTER